MPASLARQYAEPITLVSRDDAPHRFVWRGRQWTVRGVLDRWVVTGDWWEPRDAVGWDDEWEFWRAEATPGAGRPVAVVELCHRTSTGGWTLHRLFD